MLHPCTAAGRATRYLGQLWCHDKIGRGMLARVDSGWPQEAMGSSDLYSFADTRKMDITMYCDDVERTWLRTSRGDWTSDKKGSDGPNVVTGVYFLTVSSESSSNMPDRAHPQSAPARQIAQVALRLPNCDDRGGCAGIRRCDMDCMVHVDRVHIGPDCSAAAL